MIKRYFVNALILHSAKLFHNGWFYSMRMGKIQSYNFPFFRVDSSKRSQDRDDNVKVKVKHVEGFSESVLSVVVTGC